MDSELPTAVDLSPDFVPVIDLKHLRAGQSEVDGLLRIGSVRGSLGGLETPTFDQGTDLWAPEFTS